jgi:flagellar biosynthesis protein FliR
MDLFSFDPRIYLSFFLTLFRISLIVFMLPFFGGENIPLPAKAALCLVLALGLWPHLAFSADYFPAHPFMIALMILGELILGLALGLIVRVLFAAIQTGGQLVGFQMGFAMVNVVDPSSGVSMAVTAHFLYMTSLLIFLSLNGHLHLLHALAHSFSLVPPGGLLLTPNLSEQMIRFSSQIFILAIKIATPVMVALFLIDLALALVAKAAPQMNVIFVGFPLKIAVGFLFLGTMFTIMGLYVQDFILMLGSMFQGVMLSGR